MPIKKYAFFNISVWSGLFEKLNWVKEYWMINIPYKLEVVYILRVIWSHFNGNIPRSICSLSLLMSKKLLYKLQDWYVIFLFFFPGGKGIFPLHILALVPILQPPKVNMIYHSIPPSHTHTLLLIADIQESNWILYNKLVSWSLSRTAY